MPGSIPARRVGVVGCGAIGSVVARELAEGRVSSAVLSGVCVRSGATEFGPSLTADRLIESSDVVVEAAGQDALRELGPAVLCAGRDLVAVSVGALAEPDLFDALTEAGPGRLHVASGALGGLDMVGSVAAHGEIRSARITSTKAPASLVQSWMSPEEVCRIDEATEPVRLYAGSIRDLVRLFHSSTNVAAALALAVGSWDVVHGEVWADPHAELTRHAVEVQSSSGEYRFEFGHRPSAQNPRSSAVVPWSVVRVLRDLCGSAWRFG